MKGVSFITGEKSEVKSIVIDIKTIYQYEEEVHELIDTLIAETRKNDAVINWNDAKEILRKKGKL